MAFSQKRNKPVVKDTGFRATIVVLFCLCAMFIGIDFIQHPEVIKIQEKTKLTIGVVFLMMLLKLLFSTASFELDNSEDKVDDFTLKAVLYVKTSPNDFMKALIEENIRREWDLKLKIVELKEDTLKVSYLMSAPCYYEENLKYAYTKEDNGNVIIEELVNSKKERYYVI